MRNHELPDLLQEADPQDRRGRLSIPAWSFSLVLHGAVLCVLATLAVRVAKSLPTTDRTLEVGVVLKSEEPNATIYQNADQTFVDPKPSEPAPLLEAAIAEALPALDSSTAPKLDLDPILLAEMGQQVRETPSALPRVTPPGGGARTRTKFFSVESVGNSFVFVIDRSASMSHKDALALAKQQLLQGLALLKPESTFQVVFYNTESLLLPFDDGKLLSATKPNIGRATTFLEQVTASGGTEHNAVLLAAFKLQPEVVYFLTDADMMTDRDVAMLTAANRKARHPATIYTIEFGNGPRISVHKPLRRLADENDGTYTYVDVQTLGSSP